MGLKGYYLKSDDTNGNYYVNLISMYTSMNIVMTIHLTTIFIMTLF